VQIAQARGAVFAGRDVGKNDLETEITDEARLEVQRQLGLPSITSSLESGFHSQPDLARTLWFRDVRDEHLLEPHGLRRLARLRVSYGDLTARDGRARSKTHHEEPPHGGALSKRCAR
jgi:hypothetical protein